MQQCAKKFPHVFWGTVGSGNKFHRALIEWPVFLPRCDSQISASAEKSALRAHAAGFGHFSYGLRANNCCGVIQSLLKGLVLPSTTKTSETPRRPFERPSCTMTSMDLRI